MNSSGISKLSEPHVDILLATFNGERFLAQQIESILNQDYTHLRLVIRDDGSSDGTMAIIRKFIGQYPEKISLLNDSMGNVGCAGNFFRLIESSRADYAMLSDQDDVWLPGKVSVTMGTMRANEEKYGQSTPLLIHTDLRVCDENLSVLSDSFWQYQKISPACDAINRILVQNVVTGCTVMLNRSLMALVRPVGGGMIEHDWWLALMAASFGRIGYVHEATILYRQHGRNAVGAVKWNALGMTSRFFSEQSRYGAKLEKTRLQAALFLKVYAHLLRPRIRQKIWRYSTLGELNLFHRLICVVWHRFFKIGILRNIGMMLKIASLR